MRTGPELSTVVSTGQARGRDGQPHYHPTCCHSAGGSLPELTAS